MKKNILILLFVFFISCEKDSESIIEVGNNSKQIINIQIPDTVVYNTNDSTFTAQIEYIGDKINNIEFRVYSEKGEIFVSKSTELSHVQIKQGLETVWKFSGKAFFGLKNSTGKYLAEFTGDFSRRQEVLGVKYFLFINKLKNYPPEISNLILPDSINREVEFNFSVKVEDPNGLQNISKVVYKLYKPDGTEQKNSNGISEFPLNDNGENGDIKSGDGVFSAKLIFPASVNIGNWKFKFYAVDKSNSISNQIEKTVKVK